MHDGQLFVLAIIAMGIFGGIIKMAIRARHGLPIEESGRDRRLRQRLAERGGSMDDQRKIELLSSENERLTGQVGRLEERLRVLERIATDPATRVAREIDELRDRD